MYDGARRKIFKYSNLQSYLNTIDYPLKPNKELNICHDVTFQIPVQKEKIEIQCDVAMCVAPCHSLNLVSSPNGQTYDKMTEYEITQMRNQIRYFLTASFSYDIVICSALGCGHFRNDPIIVSKLFKSELEQMNMNQKVSQPICFDFCIYKEGHSKDNYSIFYKELNGMVFEYKEPKETEKFIKEYCENYVLSVIEED